MRFWLRRPLLLTLALLLLGLAGLCFAVAAAHPSDNTYVGAPLMGVALLLLSVPLVLASVLSGPAARQRVLVTGSAVACVLLLLSSVVLISVLAIVPLGILLLLAALVGLGLLMVRTAH